MSWGAKKATHPLKDAFFQQKVFLDKEEKERKVGKILIVSWGMKRSEGRKFSSSDTKHDHAWTVIWWKERTDRIKQLFLPPLFQYLSHSLPLSLSEKMTKKKKVKEKARESKREKNCLSSLKQEYLSRKSFVLNDISTHFLSFSSYFISHLFLVTKGEKDAGRRMIEEKERSKNGTEERSICGVRKKNSNSMNVCLWCRK